MLSDPLLDGATNSIENDITHTKSSAALQAEVKGKADLTNKLIAKYTTGAKICLFVVVV